MPSPNVSNYFEQPEGDGSDNVLVLGGSVENSSGVSLKSMYISVTMADVSTASSVYISPGRACTFKRLVSSLQSAITAADSAITTSIDGATVTNGGMTIAYSGSAAGDVDTATPTALNTLTASQSLRIQTDGASSTAAAIVYVAEFQLS